VTKFSKFEHEVKLTALEERQLEADLQDVRQSAEAARQEATQSEVQIRELREELEKARTWNAQQQEYEHLLDQIAQFKDRKTSQEALGDMEKRFAEQQAQLRKLDADIARRKAKFAVLMSVAADLCNDLRTDGEVSTPAIATESTGSAMEDE